MVSLAFGLNLLASGNSTAGLKVLNGNSKCSMASQSPKKTNQSPLHWLNPASAKLRTKSPQPLPPHRKQKRALNATRQSTIHCFPVVRVNACVNIIKPARDNPKTLLHIKSLYAINSRHKIKLPQHVTSTLHHPSSSRFNPFSTFSSLLVSIPSYLCKTQICFILCHISTFTHVNIAARSYQMSL